MEGRLSLNLLKGKFFLSGKSKMIHSPFKQLRHSNLLCFKSVLASSLAKWAHPGKTKGPGNAEAL